MLRSLVDNKHTMSAVFNEDRFRPRKNSLLNVGSNANAKTAADAGADGDFWEEPELIDPFLDTILAITTFLEADTTPRSGVLLAYFHPVRESAKLVMIGKP